MALPGTKPANPEVLKAHAFKPGQSGNPGGKPQGARNRLQGKFLNALAEDFDAHGKRAIERCREEDPSAYLRAIVALMPKELEISRPLDELTDEQLESVLAAVAAVNAARDSATGEGAEAGAQPAAGLSPVHEAS